MFRTRELRQREKRHKLSARRKGNFMKFNKIPKQDNYTLENQDGAIIANSLDDVRKYYTIMLEEPDEFIVLTSPDVINSVRFVQATKRGVDSGVELELGMDDGELLGRECEENEALLAFEEFFAGNYTPDLSKFDPVRF